MLSVIVFVRKLHKNCACRHYWNCHDMGEVSRLMQLQSDQNIQWKHVKYANSSTDSRCGRTNSSNSSWKTTKATSWPFAIFPTLAEEVEEIWKWLCPVLAACQPKTVEKVFYSGTQCFNQIRFWLKRLIPIERDLRVSVSKVSRKI